MLICKGKNTQTDNTRGAWQVLWQQFQAARGFLYIAMISTFLRSI